MEDTNALSALNQFIMPETINQSPLKMPPMDDMMQQILQGLPLFAGMNNASGVQEEKQSGSEDSDSPRQGSPSSDQNDAAVPIKDFLKPPRSEGWYECFNTTSKSEFDALIYSMYVIDKDERKLDGWQYYECFNRLQNKCRYKVRAKKQDEFHIIEEKCGHNHGIEPVGQAGSHAGLPKTLREIVDKSFNEDWPSHIRQMKIEEEVRRLGLPPNPRLGRQVDNRVAYLRRVKNLNETKKMQENTQMAVSPDGAMFPPHMMQMMMDQGLLGPSVGQVITQKMAMEQKQQQQKPEVSAIQALLEAQKTSPVKIMKHDQSQPILQLQQPPQELQSPPELAPQLQTQEIMQEHPRQMDPLEQLQQLAMQNALSSEKLAELGFHI